MSDTLVYYKIPLINGEKMCPFCKNKNLILKQANIQLYSARKPVIIMKHDLHWCKNCDFLYTDREIHRSIRINGLYTMPMVLSNKTNLAQAKALCNTVPPQAATEKNPYEKMGFKIVKAFKEQVELSDIEHFDFHVPVQIESKSGKIFFDLTFPYNKSTLYIYDSVKPCHHDKLEKDRIASVCTITKTEYSKIYLDYCPLCQKLYMPKENFDSYQARLGLVLKIDYPLNFDYNPLLEQPTDRVWYYKPYTKLLLYGYKVSDNSLTTYHRQRILMYIAFFGLMSPADIRKQITSHIYQRGKKCLNARAIWESDLEYINKYTSNINKGEYVVFRELKNKWFYDRETLKEEFLEKV